MFVKKFEADTLDEALKMIKMDLGPDAIILKTVSNKGIKGAFGKKKIEITAAISEKSLGKKSNVDKIFKPEQKEQFYRSSASNIANMIDQHAEMNPKTNSGYGALGLNKVVKKTTDALKTSLDDFLGGREEIEENSNSQMEVEDYRSQSHISNNNRTSPKIQHQPQEEPLQIPSLQTQEMDYYRRKIENLEEKLFNLTKMVERVEPKEARSIHEMRVYLKSLNVDEKFIRKIIKKAVFEFNDQDLEDADIVNEFMLREVAENIGVDLPVFSKVQNQSSITILISEGASGQSTTAIKLCSMLDKEYSVLIQYSPDETSDSFATTKKMFEIDSIICKSIPEIMSECRKASEIGKTIFVDYKSRGQSEEEVKKFINGLQRVFNNMEVLVCLSAIHDEVYNRKVVNKFRSFANGIIFSHIDLCLNFGSIFNVQYDASKMPIKFFTTGTTVPEDIEAATVERLIAGMFNIA